MKTCKKFMKQALKEAEKALKIDEVPIGAVIVYNNEIIGRGYNLKEKSHDPTAHAEMIAIKEAVDFFSDWRLYDCYLYVTIEPCPMCAGAIQQARIKKVIYGASDPKAGAAGSLFNLLQDDRFNHQVEVQKGIMADKARSLLQKFFQKLRNQNN